jgi:hypothetical protein
LPNKEAREGMIKRNFENLLTGELNTTEFAGLLEVNLQLN